MGGDFSPLRFRNSLRVFFYYLVKSTGIAIERGNARTESGFVSHSSQKPRERDVNVSDEITMYSARSFSRMENRERKKMPRARARIDRWKFRSRFMSFLVYCLG